MKNAVEKSRHKYLIDNKGHEKTVVLAFKELKNILEPIEDPEDASDLLRAEGEATICLPANPDYS